MHIEPGNIKNVVSGVVVPMISPFNNDYTIDTSAVERLVDRFVVSQVAPFVLGTTGEAPSMTTAQKKQLVKATVDAANGKCTVYAGISGNSLQTSIDEGKMFADLGADVLVATPPGYYPSNNVQLEKYFVQLADELPLPLVMYNMPATTQCSINVDLIETLSHHSNIAGLKDSERDESRIGELVSLFKKRNDFSLLIGWAAQSVKSLIAGYDGIVPSTGNIIPYAYYQLYKAAKNGNADRASELQQFTNEVSSWYQKGLILSESIPALKLLCSAKGLCGPVVLPPMYRPESQSEEKMLADFKVRIEKMKQI
ncbi:MAG: dihydrodipicolinate synthase family protein [Prolixibacteraceae bacterium]|nr:dihydrodipicolinate synthase family protein [Prolixibacteraceae bacterium]